MITRRNYRHLNRKNLCLTGLVALVPGLLVPSMASDSQENRSPNFIIILVDDLGWADVKCNYPGTFYDTPNIDKLAENGIRFTNAYSAAPVSSPTRAAIMTGYHPCRTGITDWIPGDAPGDRPLLGPEISNELALEEVTLAEKLKESGYRTFFAGKWHLGGEGFFPEDQGFDINIGGHNAGTPPGGYYSPYNNPKLTDGPEGEYLTDRLTDESIRFIENNTEQPFLLYLSFYTVHTPIQYSKKFIDKYQAKREEAGFDTIPYRREGEGWTKLIQENSAYASMVAAMDENVGRLIAAVEENGLAENTWVIFTSDNGGLSTLARRNAPTSNGPLRAGKGWCYEGGIRVPLIISGPGALNPGRVSDQPVISMDIFPTVMTLAGIKQQNTDGVSLYPVITGNKTVKRDVLFWHYPHYHTSAWRPGSALRKGDWKLIFYYEDNRAELFNLKDDPGEEKDLSEKFPTLAKKLRRLLDKNLIDTNGKLPQPNL